MSCGRWADRAGCVGERSCQNADDEGTVHERGSHAGERLRRDPRERTSRTGERAPSPRLGAGAHARSSARARAAGGARVGLHRGLHRDPARARGARGRARRAPRLPRLLRQGSRVASADTRTASCATGCPRPRSACATAASSRSRATVTPRSTSGLLCVKGYHVGLALYGSDRLTQPQLRQERQLRTDLLGAGARRRRGSHRWRTRLGFAFYGSGQWTIPEGYAARSSSRAGLGTNHIEANARLCMASAVTGFLADVRRRRARGLLRRPRSLRRAHHLGQQPRGDAPGPLLARDRSARARRARDAHRHRHAPHAHDVVRRPRLLFRPQSDLAIANGIAHLLLERGTYDRGLRRAAHGLPRAGGRGHPDLRGAPSRSRSTEPAWRSTPPSAWSRSRACRG
jgi:hypothetical protein